MQTIPGVTIKSYWQDRLLHPEADGFVGELHSGSAVIEIAVESGAHIIGMQQQGRDMYQPMRNWMEVETWPEPKPAPDLPPAGTSRPKVKKWMRQRGPNWWQRSCKAWWNDTGRRLSDTGQVFRKKMQLSGNANTANSFVDYPNNLVAIAEHVHEDGQPTDRVRVWKIALVSQLEHQYFLTCQLVYDTTAYHGDSNTIVIPRVDAHATLHDLLAGHISDGDHLVDVAAYQDEEARAMPLDLPAGQGLVDNWYHARGMGVLLTAGVEARVCWRDIPARDRYRYLVPGEIVEIGRLGKPKAGDTTTYRKQPRKSRIEQQAFAVELVAASEPAMV